MLSAGGALEDSAKLQLEGLLQARSEDMRHARGSRWRREVQTVVFERPLLPTIRSYGTSSVRRCDECGDEIGARRLRAMPRTSLCLHCQRSSERAVAPT